MAGAACESGGVIDPEAPAVSALSALDSGVDESIPIEDGLVPDRSPELNGPAPGPLDVPPELRDVPRGSGFELWEAYRSAALMRAQAALDAASATADVVVRLRVLEDVRSKALMEIDSSVGPEEVDVWVAETTVVAVFRGTAAKGIALQYLDQSNRGRLVGEFIALLEASGKGYELLAAYPIRDEKVALAFDEVSVDAFLGGID
jgi:hypothetical protein